MATYDEMMEYERRKRAPSDHIVSADISVRVEKLSNGDYKVTSQMVPGLFCAGRTPEEALSGVGPLMKAMANMPHRDDLAKTETP